MSLESLGSEHVVEGFSCGVESLDRYLVAQAFADQRAEKSRTYVLEREERVVAYFTLAATGMNPQDASVRLAAGQGAQMIPLILLARLAVDEVLQGQGIGEAMLLEALARCASAAETIGARAVLVHATGERAAAFYRRYGFEESRTDPLNLTLLMKDIRETFGMG